MENNETNISTISCPECGFKKEETMPEDSCQFFYACENCKAVLKPKKGDCCVYCSYESIMPIHSEWRELHLNIS